VEVAAECQLLAALTNMNPLNKTKLLLANEFLPTATG
jgi:hypothetical protein